MGLSVKPDATVDLREENVCGGTCALEPAKGEGTYSPCRRWAAEGGSRSEEWTCAEP